MLKLRFKDNPTQAVWLVEPKVSVGVSPDNDLVLSGVNACMHHADILVEHEVAQFQLADTAGDTFINGKRINAERAYNLSVNDVISVCGQELELVDPKQEPRPKPSEQAKAENTGWALKSNSVALSNRIYPLASSVVIGRSNECDITLAAAHLSRRHASLQVKNGLLYVKDLGSSNGTYLNGSKIAEGRVKRGDELCFDTLSFGVIGPSDELDKTTVRSVSRPLAASAQAVPRAAAPVSKSETVKVTSKKVPTGRAVASSSASDSTVAESSENVSTGQGGWGIGVIVVAVLAAGGWWLFGR